MRGGVSVGQGVWVGSQVEGTAGQRATQQVGGVQAQSLTEGRAESACTETVRKGSRPGSSHISFVLKYVMTSLILCLSAKNERKKEG